MKYLSRIVLDLQTAAKYRIKDSYAWHQAIWKAFPDSKSRQFIFRVEVKPSGYLLYLISKTLPKKQLWGDWKTKEISTTYLEHNTYYYKLRANPTRRYLKDPAGNPYDKGKRFVVADPVALENWIIRKSEVCGFILDLEQLKFSPPINQPFYKNGKRGNHKRVDYEGVLTVNDHHIFKLSFNNGIGSAKAFGFGLLMLQPLD